MARLTACFALSAVLLLATGICSGNGQFLLDPDTKCLKFPPELPVPVPLPGDALSEAYKTLSNLPPMRIISKGDTSLSIAVDDDRGLVVLAKTNCSNPAQLWVQQFAGSNRFLLVNIATNGQARAIQIPDVGKNEVRLAPYGPFSIDDQSLQWMQDPLNDDVVFYNILSIANPSLFLDGLLFGKPNVDEGTVVGAFPAGHDEDNIYWKIEGFLSNP